MGMNVDELLGIVKQEAARREGRAPSQPAAATIAQASPSVPCATQPLAPRYLTSKPRRHVRDFLPLLGEEFIHAAFQAILWRNADDQARDVYLDAVMARGVSKWEILARLRYSVEGRKKTVSIAGLWPAVAFSLAYRVPVITVVLSAFAQLLVFPAYLRDLKLKDARAFAFLRALGR